MKKYTLMILEKAKTLPGLNLLNPVMNFLNSGDVFKQPISFIYLLFALGCALLPLYFLYEVFDNSFFRYANGGAIFGFLFIFVIVIITAVFGCRYWLERSAELQETSEANSEYVGTPVLTNFIQNLGEWAGVTFAIAGAAIAFIGGTMGGDIFGFDEIADSTLLAMITCVITGFIIILITRVWAELIRALTTIANNTKK